MAFGVTELLENIVSNLSQKDLLLLQRISKKWQSAITGYIKYEEAMCFMPAEIFSEAAKKAKPQVFGHTFEAPKLSSATSAQGFLNMLQLNEYTLNPMLSAFFFKVVGGTSSGPYEYKLETQKLKLKGSAIHKMYLTQPPTTMVELKSEKNGNCCIASQIIKKATGVTLGDLVTAVSRQVGPGLTSNDGGPITIFVSALRDAQLNGSQHSTQQARDYYHVWMMCQGLDVEV